MVGVFQVKPQPKQKTCVICLMPFSPIIDSQQTCCPAHALEWIWIVHQGWRSGQVGSNEGLH